MKINNILVSKSNVYIKILENESEKDKMIKKRQFASFCDKYSKKIAPFNYKMYKANWRAVKKDIY